MFQNGLGLKIKQPTLANSPWAYIREGSLSEGYFRLRFGWLFSEELIIGILRYGSSPRWICAAVKGMVFKQPLGL